MKVFFVRHGEVASNVERRPHQDPHEPLTDRGREQAAFLAERFKTIPIDAIIASTMTRAHDTALAIAQTTGHEVWVSDLLIEHRRPSELKGLLAVSREAQAIHDERAKHLDDPHYRYSDEETFAELRERAIRALAFIAGSGHERVVVVTHGYFLKAMIGCMFNGDDLKPLTSVRLGHFLVTSNTGITVAHYGEGRWQLLTWNDHAHLGEIKR